MELRDSILKMRMIGAVTLLTFFSMSSALLHAQKNQNQARTTTRIRLSGEKNSSSSWEMIPTGGSGIFNAVQYIDPHTVSVLNDLGYLTTSTDDGITWMNYSTFLQDSIYGMHFLNKSEGFLTGDRGALYKTQNAGVSWRQRIHAQRSSITPSYYDEFFAMDGSDSSLIIVVGSRYTYLRSTDGGTSWVYGNLSYKKSLSDVQVITPKKVVAVGDSGLIVLSSDSGINWEALPRRTKNELRAVHFINESIGIAVSLFGDVLRTIDAGLSWSFVVLPFKDYLFDVRFIDEQNAFIVGAQSIAQSTDGGLSWRMDSLKFTNHPQICFFNHDTGIITRPDQFVYLRTTNAGKFWDTLKVDRKSLYSCWVTGIQSGIGSFNTGPMKTIDGGRTWLPHEFVFDRYPERYGLRSMYSWNSTAMVSLGFEGFIYKSSDGGYLWNAVHSQTKKLKSTFFPMKSMGFAVGSNGSIFRTTDRGETWTKQDYKLRPNLRAIHGLDSLMTCVGEKGAIVISENAGTSWNVISSIFSIDLNSVFVIDSVTIVAVGNSGVILRSTNKGKTWLLQYTNVNAMLLSVMFPTKTVGYVVGEEGTVLRTTDAGFNWQKLDFPIQVDLYSVSFIDSLNGYVSGEQGSLFRTRNGGLTTIDGSQVSTISGIALGEVFPHPVQMNTTIKYRLSRTSLLSLTIIDMLGRPIRKIFEEEREAGSYSHQLDVRGLSNGMYYLALTNGSEVIRKKIVVMR